MTTEDKLNGRLHGEQPPAERDNLVMRLVYFVLIGLMISVAVNVLGVIALVQFVIMVVNKGQPNENLGDFGTDLGVWLAKAARYMCAASNVKPWPWTEID